ncbi:MAG: hypothetical protein N2561_03725 [Bacteroidetes bacterium]|nr:hypothetical protein [Rhodothermia bacterium]MCS7154333.1 hypothetical protein [Bacteroidota bacterium]MCX7906630.1 hypothetical protein [Bacteroidota bacterium]MDW8137089.1 hypothetical protein [Bacteroidota bacterium]MDW8285040.1 hypothetical protein [Bacteroidota bacterium]
MGSRLTLRWTRAIAWGAVALGLVALSLPFARLSYWSLNEAFPGRLAQPLALLGRWVPAEVVDLRSGYSALDVLRWLPELRQLAPVMGFKEWAFAIGPLWMVLSTILLLLLVLLRQPLSAFLGDLIALVPLLYGLLLVVLCWIWYGSPLLPFSLLSWGYWLGLAALMVGSAALVRS